MKYKLLVMVGFAIFVLTGCGGEAGSSKDIEAVQGDSAAATPATTETAPVLEVGDVFQDCEDCPKMVVVPPGSFRMGASRLEQDWAIEKGRSREDAEREGPAHQVTIDKPFAVGIYEVSMAEFLQFAADDGLEVDEAESCTTMELVDGAYVREERQNRSWKNVGVPRPNDHPVSCVTWYEATDFAAWLSNRTGESYRLISEAEWEYVARAGSDTFWFWQDESAICEYANMADDTPHPNGEYWPKKTVDCSDGYALTSPVGVFEPNAFGIYDVAGNVWEWVADCGNENYEGAPSDGSAWLNEEACTRHVLRGGALHEDPVHVRSAIRGIYKSEGRMSTDGFRIVRDIS
jgi:sulfatase modifying factor 1